MEEQLKPQIIEPKFLEILMSMGETIGYLDKEMQEKPLILRLSRLKMLFFR